VVAWYSLLFRLKSSTHLGAAHLAHPARAKRRDNFIRHGFCSRYEAHFSLISSAQFKMMDKGAGLGSSTFTLIRNLWPSRVTS